MIFYIVFDIDGRELKRGTCQPECLDMQRTQETDLAIMVDRELTDQSPVHFLDGMTVRPCSEFEIHTSRNRIGNIPAGTIVTYEDQTNDLIIDGEIEFESDIEDRILVYLSHREYRETAIEIEVGP